jgi:hypothetical protein
VIVKPSMGAGTQHFAVVRTPHEAAQWSAEARAVDLSHIPSNPWHAELLTEGRRGNEIAAELGLAKSTVSWHIKRLGIKGSRDYVGRRAIVATPAERDVASVSCAT